jgi:hypothetical protein
MMTPCGKIGRAKPKGERTALRGDWFGRSLARLAGKDIVCVDPDNGLVVPSAKGRPKVRTSLHMGMPERARQVLRPRAPRVVYYHAQSKFEKDPFMTRTIKVKALLRAPEDLPESLLALR